MKMKGENIRRFTGIGLLIASVIIFIGIFLPWISLSISWEFSPGSHGEVTYRMNGLGLGQGTASIHFENGTYSYTIKKNWDSFSPILLPFGGALFGVIIVNSITSMYFLSKKTRLTLPKGFREHVGDHTSRILLLEGISTLLVPFVFSLSFFHVPVESPLSSVNKPGIGGKAPAFQSSSPSLFGFYRSIMTYFYWVTNSYDYYTRSLQRSLQPGIGFFLVWIAGILTIYVWYINLILREEWPNVWQKRSILLPLMIILAFTPIFEIVSKTSGSLPPLVLSGVWYHTAGPLYLLLTLVLTYLSRKTALIERELNKKTGEFYTEEKLNTGETETLLETIESKKEKTRENRKIIGVLNFLILLLVAAIIGSIMVQYVKYIREIGGGFRMMSHTIWNWPFVFAPVINCLLLLIYVR